MAFVPVIPVLSLNTDQLVKREDQIAYIIRHAFYNPGWTSSQIEDELVSMRRLVAHYELDKDEFVSMLRKKLELAIKHLYAELSVNVESYDVDPTKYGVTISVVDSQGNLVLASNNIRVKDNKIILEFDKE